jgi:hypothetical protein
MAQDMSWLESHVGSLEKGIELINRLYWNLSITKIGEQWFVQAGDQMLLRTDSRGEVDVFIYGMSLAYSVVPNAIIEQIRSDLDIE